MIISYNNSMYAKMQNLHYNLETKSNIVKDKSETYSIR